jgi:D-threo-aldose 1-dehydrogenase
MLVIRSLRNDGTNPAMTTLFAPCEVSGLRLGLGGAPLGNLFAPVAETDARALLDAAWAGGCRSFDTAPHYGHGLSEQRIGAALGRRPRQAFLLSSKVGRLLTPRDDVPREQHGYVDGLARLDVAYVHDCDAATHGAQAARVLRQVCDETLPALQALKQEGLVGAVGLGVNNVQVVLDVLRRAPLDALLLAGRYSLLDFTALASLWPACQARGVHVALGGVFNSGLLASGTRGGAAPRFDYAPAAREWIDRTARIEAVCEAHGVPLRAAALQFPLAHPAVEIVMVGARSAAEWDDACAMLRRPIPASFWADLRNAGLIPEAAPTP